MQEPVTQVLEKLRSQRDDIKNNPKFIEEAIALSESDKREGPVLQEPRDWVANKSWSCSRQCSPWGGRQAVSLFSHPLTFLLHSLFPKLAEFQETPEAEHSLQSSVVL